MTQIEMQQFLNGFTKLYPVWLFGTALLAFFWPPCASSRKAPLRKTASLIGELTISICDQAARATEIFPASA
jgi:hypothetical protein